MHTQKAYTSVQKRGKLQDYSKDLVKGTIAHYFLEFTETSVSDPATAWKAKEQSLIAFEDIRLFFEICEAAAKQ